MKNLILVVISAMFGSIVVSTYATAQEEPAESAVVLGATQRWTPGWDNFQEPLNYKLSTLTWAINPSKSTLSVTYNLVGAKPNKLYQAGIIFFCRTFPSTFGQFPVGTNGGECGEVTRQGVTKSATGPLVGVVTTDIHGDGSFSVTIGPIQHGTYDVEFWMRDGAAGCDGNQGSDFQSPGPKWGDATVLTIE